MALTFAQTINLDVNGVKIGSSNSFARKKLGKPTSSKRGGIVPCNDGSTRRTLRYSGLVLRLESNKEDTDFGIYEIEISSPKWAVSGLKIGATKREVIAKFGKGSELNENGKPYLAYYIQDGYASFYFTKERLIKIYWVFNFC